MNKNGYIYFMTNKPNSVLYIGVKSNLVRRVAEHKAKLHKGFTEKYNCDKLVYFEHCDSISDAIAREKQLKNWRREWKNELICGANPTWNDLSSEIGLTDDMIAGIAGRARNDMVGVAGQARDDGRQRRYEPQPCHSEPQPCHSEPQPCHSELDSESPWDCGSGP
ncbi:MAG: GIY-YIG nuclease family protein [Clostridiales Family XIII bacterium]|jgi:putative endonuclease|nr:GIY-YIG nuclease family protein [Clostridiales Family XIII bacterium]